jgi:hypothetical protein
VPLTIPNLDNRRFKDLFDEAIARIPVYTPEYTNFNKSDPGVTLIEVFAFLTENLLYRCNQIPERNRKKFLKLLNIPLQPATAAQGLITITNADTNQLKTITLNDDVEVRAGQVPFRTTRGIDVLPIEGRIYFKQTIPSPTQAILDYYNQLYASFRGSPQASLPTLYQVVAFPQAGSAPVALSDTVDGYLWLALLGRDVDQHTSGFLDIARDVIAGKTLSVGIVPFLVDGTKTLASGRSAAAPAPVTLLFDIPNLPASGGLLDSQNRIPSYRPLNSQPTGDLFSAPGFVDVTLPAKSDLRLWNNIDPLESGVNQLPPSLDDSALHDRLITWLRIRPSTPGTGRFLWMGINSVPVSQREHIFAEVLPNGSGEPDQTANLAQAPVLPESVTVTVIPAQGEKADWTPVDDLFLAGPEVPTPDLTQPPGSPAMPSAESKVFLLDAEAGQITFGDGIHGSRPPELARMLANYDFCKGAAGNVGAGSINTSPVLQGLKVNNPLATWGGADAETPNAGEKQISHYLQHRDRLVTAYDFEAITLRTPGVQIGRVNVIPNFHPELSSGRGDAPGAITLMLIPAVDPDHPDAPVPSNDFLNTVCSYLDSRRLITTEVYLRGPEYIGIWVSIGIQVLPGVSAAPVREDVKAAVIQFLAPTRGGAEELPGDPAALLNAPQTAPDVGWPLGKSVIALEIMAVAGRVKGIEFVNEVLLATDGAAIAQLDISGLQLPRILGFSVKDGAATPIDELRSGPSAATTTSGGTAQVPVIPGECR